MRFCISVPGGHDVLALELLLTDTVCYAPALLQLRTLSVSKDDLLVTCQPGDSVHLHQIPLQSRLLFL